MQLFQLTEPGQQDEKFITKIESDPILGIDLGTTNSIAAYFDGSKTVFIKDDKGRCIIPSTVLFNEKEVIVGNNSQQAFSSIKRYMGHAYKEHISYPYEAKNCSEHGIRFKCTTGWKSPIEISAEILKHLKNIAEKQLGKSVKRIVLTVPAYFDETARKATKDAAQLAGLDVIRLISEPTAASIAYGFDKAEEGIYAVYDLGGGTFDVSILRMIKGILQVISTSGNVNLGGDDFDDAFKNSLIAKLPNLSIADARTIKERLTTNQSVEYDGLIITEADLENATASLTKSTTDIFDNALHDAGIKVDDLNEIILVGGSTRMNHISKIIENTYGKKPKNSLDPDLSVAMGAAIQAANLQTNSNNLLLDVTPLSLKIEVADSIADTLIPRNTPIPCTRDQKFTTQVDNQTGFVIHVLQGESDMVPNCRSLAKFHLKIPPLPKGHIKVNVTYKIDADGILTVNATELETNKSHEIMVKPSYGLESNTISQYIS